MKLFFSRLGLLLCACAIQISALEISTTFGKEAGEDFSVLTLRNDSAFTCGEVLDAYGKAVSIECKISRIPDRGFPGLENSFFRVSYKMIDGDFWLYIYPKHQQKLFAIPKSPKQDFSIDKYPSTTAHLWQIVGYKKTIPFLSHENFKQGLHFPVKILGEQTPTIPELNTDNKPLKATKNKDFEIYSRVKTAMERKDYIGAITEINEALQQNPNSVFRRDLTYDRIIASSKLDLEEQDVLIESALEWVRIFAADPDVPEILYILAAAYRKDNIPTEAEHYYKRISSEYPESKFTPLAQMQLANLVKTHAPTQARIYFQRAYIDAKDIPSASEIAIEWAIFELEQQNSINATELVNKVLANYPKFFLDNDEIAKELSSALLEAKDYPMIATLTQYLADNSDDIYFKEEKMFVLGDYYQQAQDFEQAHQANQQYIQVFGEDHPERAKVVQDRDDAILFAIDGGDEEKLKHYAYLISKYPNTQEATKAKELTAQILLQKHKYQEVFALYKDEDSSPYRQQALDALLKDAIAQKNCKEAIGYIMQTSVYNLDSAQKLVAFDCADEAGLNTIAKQIASGMAEASKDQGTRLLWLYRIASNLYKLGAYKEASLAARDALNLAKIQKSHYDIAFTLFAILQALESKNEAKKLLPFLQEHFAKDERIIPVYATLLGYVIDEKDPTSIEVYASKIIELQKAFKTDEFSPYAEFALANVLRELKRYDQALALLLPLESTKLTEVDSTQLLYRIASLYDVLNNAPSALKYFDKCAKSADQNEWKTLCTQAKELLQERAKSSSKEPPIQIDSAKVDSNASGNSM